MIELARNLDEKYRVFVLPNTDEIHFPHIWENYPELHFLENRLMISYELGAVKPFPEIYKVACNKFDIKPAESIFIDDKKENI